MKIKIFLAIAILILGLTGCSPKEEQDLVQEGKMALEKHEYTQAAKIFSEALETDDANEHARAMYMQATRMLSASEYEKQKNYKKAIIDLEFIENIKGGSSAIKSEASNKKKELVKLQEEYETAQQERKQNAKNASVNNTYKMEQKALAEYQKQQEEQKKKEEENKQEEEEQNNQEEEEQNSQTDSNAQPDLPQPDQNIQQEAIQ